MRSTLKAVQRIPVLSLSVPLQVALLDEFAVNVTWQNLFEGLVQEIEAALRRTELSAEALPAAPVEPPKGIPRSSEAA
jgi:hypothetical protein